MVFCTNCGATLDADAKYCSRCGAVVTSTPSPVPTPQGAAPPIPPRRSRGPVLGILATAAVVIVAGIGAYVLMGRDDASQRHEDLCILGSWEWSLYEQFDASGQVTYVTNDTDITEPMWTFRADGSVGVQLRNPEHAGLYEETYSYEGNTLTMHRGVLRDVPQTVTECTDDRFITVYTLDPEQSPNRRLTWTRVPAP